MPEITIKATENVVKTHKNKARVNCRWAIGLLFPDGIRFVTSVEWSPKTFQWESGKEAIYFDSKEYVDDVAFGMQMNLYAAVVMEVPDGFILKNPENDNVIRTVCDELERLRKEVKETKDTELVKIRETDRETELKAIDLVSDLFRLEL